MSGTAPCIASTVAASLEASGFAVRSQIIWDKTRLVIGRGDYHWQHEPAWYAVRKGRKGHWAGDRKQTTVWAIPHRKSPTGHGTEKPVECMRRPIENNSSPGQAVYEPFSGSGTTIIAAEMTGRCCHAIELDPVYVDVAVTRWQEFTGQAAVLEGDGQDLCRGIAAARQWASSMTTKTAILQAYGRQPNVLDCSGYQPDEVRSSDPVSTCWFVASTEVKLCEAVTRRCGHSGPAASLRQIASVYTGDFGNGLRMALQMPRIRSSSEIGLQEASFGESGDNKLPLRLASDREAV